MNCVSVTIIVFYHNKSDKPSKVMSTNLRHKQKNKDINSVSIWAGKGHTCKENSFFLKNFLETKFIFHNFS